MVNVSGHIVTRDEGPAVPTENPPPNESPQDRNALRFVPGLDGLRGVAVLAVMAFHAGVGAVSGGLLGVDMFFVLSGFLVTSLLLAEYARTNTIKLLAFWARRARRLLPALLVLLIGIGAYARWVGGGIPPSQLRGDAFFTLIYSANWHFIASGQDYFVRFGALSPLLHTWSLAVEEQFYLVWPLIALFVLRRFGRRGLGWAAGIIGLASAALCAWLYLEGASINRLYYGTDTRAQSIMVGAVLAVLVPMTVGASNLGRDASAMPSAPPPHASWYPTRAGTIAVVGLAGAAALLWALHAVRGDGALLYEGGFLLVALSTAAVIASTVELPRATLTRALCFRPLRYTGRISYGLYLYHWPLFLVLDGTRTGLSGAPLLAVRFAATFGVAALSYRFVELPVRRWGRGGVHRRVG
ncbi:MAG TPA: acyltransferase, partial [Acidimicrobiales bacterium]|nr:acyltransferase [Acidimicrobiales bacterium]